MTPLLRLEDVTAGYDRKVVLSGVTLSVLPTDVYHICGANGGGKSTLLRVMTGLMKPMSGEVCRAKDCTLGYLPQYRQIDRQFPISVRETILSGLNSKKRFWQGFSAEMQEQAADIMQRFGIAAQADQPISDLSGGQWQRTLIARALVSNPDILILDEPDTHLDREGKAFLQKVLEAEAERRAIVVVSHDHDFLPQTARLRLLSVRNGGLHAH